MTTSHSGRGTHNGNSELLQIRVGRELVGRLGVPQRSQGSHSLSSASLQSASDRPGTVPQRGRAQRSPSRLRRSTSLTALDDHDEDYDDSAQSLPQPITRINNNSQETDGNDSQHPRVLYESAPPSLASFQSVRQTITRFAQRETSPFNHSHRDSTDSHPGQPTGNQSPTRNQSPLRRFWPLKRIHSREEPFVPVDPYRFRLHIFCQPSQEDNERRRDAFLRVLAQFREVALQIYRHALLRVPSIYFSRVSRIFEEAEVSRPEIQRLIEGCARGVDFPYEWAPPVVSPALSRFKGSWEEFVDTVIREWKTLNVISALLLSAILTMFQINDATMQPIIRTASLVSLICAAWALIFGGVYIMRFWTMRSMYKASRWAQEAQKSEARIFWNVWVLLSIPAVWVAWSMIAFFVAIIAFVWTTGSSQDNPTAPPPHIELIPRVLVTALFLLGLLYFALIIHTFKTYGGKRPELDVEFDGTPMSGAILLPNIGTSDGRNGNALGLSEVRQGVEQLVSDGESGEFPNKTDSEKGGVSYDDHGRRVSSRL